MRIIKIVWIRFTQWDKRFVVHYCLLKSGRHVWVAHGTCMNLCWRRLGATCQFSPKGLEGPKYINIYIHMHVDYLSIYSYNDLSKYSGCTTCLCKYPTGAGRQENKKLDGHKSTSILYIHHVLPWRPVVFLRDPTSSQTSPWALRYFDMTSRSRFEIIWCSAHWNMNKISTEYMDSWQYISNCNPRTSRKHNMYIIYLHYSTCRYTSIHGYVSVNIDTFLLYPFSLDHLYTTCPANHWVPHICSDLKSWQLSHPRCNPHNNEEMSLDWWIVSHQSYANECTLMGTI